MKRTHNSTPVLTTAAAAALSLLGFSKTLSAVPVQGQYLEDPRCDTIPAQTLPDELGEVGFFPPNEAIQVQFQPVTFTVCVPNDGVQNDWLVQITNVSGTAWKNLFFVGNLGTRVGNADGNMIDVVLAPGVVTDAFRIDGTVTAGINNNLLFESGIVNEIFEPGETWRFAVSNFVGPNGGAPPPFFRSPGLFAGSAPLNAALPDSASILATPVPEPAIAGLFAIGATVALLRRPSRR
jgi:hypothetical protein